MDALIRFGFTIEEIKDMMDTNDSIEEVSEVLIYSLIDILKEIGCTQEDIKDILLCNPFYLTRDLDKIHDLMDQLKKVGCKHLNLIFDTNPYLLNMDVKELDRFYNKKIHEGYTNEEILEMIESSIIF